MSNYYRRLAVVSALLIVTSSVAWANDYDDAARLAAEKARRKGWLLIQDTAWAGYDDIGDVSLPCNHLMDAHSSLHHCWWGIETCRNREENRGRNEH